MESQKTHGRQLSETRSPKVLINVTSRENARVSNHAATSPTISNLNFMTGSEAVKSRVQQKVRSKGSTSSVFQNRVPAGKDAAANHVKFLQQQKK